MLDRGESEVTGSAADCVADLVYYAAEGERLVGLVKTRRLAAMQKQQRAKAGMKPPVKKGGAQPPHLHKSGDKPATELPRQTVLNVLQNIKTTEYTEYTEGR